MKRKVWMFVQQLLPKRNSQSWDPNRKALAYEPWNISVKLRGRCRLAGKLSVLSEPNHSRRIGSSSLTQKRAVFLAFSSREVTSGRMRKTGIHFIIYPLTVEEGVWKAYHYLVTAKVIQIGITKAVFVKFHDKQKWFSGEGKKWMQTRERHLLGWTIKVKIVDNI